MTNTVYVERIGKRIHARIPWADGEGPRFAKRIPGASWSKRAKRWTYPLDWAVCVRLRQVFGRHLEIGPSLHSWATAEKRRHAALVALAGRQAAELHAVPTVAPRLAAALASRTYQQVGARFAVEARASLLGDQPRLGKTLQCLAAIAELSCGGLFLVSAPATTVDVVWARETGWWLRGYAVAYPCTGRHAKRDKTIAAAQAYSAANPDTPVLVIINPAMVRVHKEKDIYGKPTGELRPPEYPQLWAISWRGLVVDESHQVLIGRNTVTMSAQRQGMVQLSKRNPNAFRLAMSGTPAKGKNQNLWGTFNWLRPDIYTSFWRWVQYYFEVDSSGYGKMIGDVRESRAKQMDHELNGIMLRRTTLEVRPELPPRQYGGTPLDPSDESSPVGIWLPLTSAQAKAYKLMVEDAIGEFAGGEMTAEGVLAEMRRLQQLASHMLAYQDGELHAIMPSNKFEYLTQALDERGIRKKDPDGSAKVVIGSQSTKTIDLFAAQFTKMGIKNLVLTGRTKQRDRPRVVDEFMNGTPRVFLIQTVTGGTGLTLNAADELFVLDETRDPSEQEQLEYRIDPTAEGDARPKTVWYLRSLGTVDEGIARDNAGADMAVKRLLDGRRDINLMRRVLLGGAA